MSDKIWVSDRFEDIGCHSLDELEAACRRARQAEAVGTWRNFHVDMSSSDPYSDREYPYLMGNRLETDAEQKERLELEAARDKLREKLELEQYERLKAKFEARND